MGRVEDWIILRAVLDEALFILASSKEEDDIKGGIERVHSLLADVYGVDVANGGVYVLENVLRKTDNIGRAIAELERYLISVVIGG